MFMLCSHLAFAWNWGCYMEDGKAEIWYWLSPTGDPHGLSCDEDGVFLGGIPLMERVFDRSDRGHLAPRPADDLSREFGLLYGMPVDMAGKRNGLSAVANALNRGDLALAKIASVQMRLPDLPHFSARNESVVKLAFLLRRSGLMKEEWDPAKHPRWPAGSADGRGGEFSPSGEDSVDAQGDRIGVGEPSSSQIVSDRCAEEWAAAYRFCEDLVTQRLLGTFGHLGFGRTHEQCVRGMVSAECGGNPVG